MTTGVALLNFGGPRTADEVEPFLYNLFADRDVIQLPVGRRIQERIARRVARRRAPEVTHQYEAIGYSPLVPVSLRQADALRAALRGRGFLGPLAVGMRYTAPWTRDAVAELKAGGVDSIVALALYPHYSIATTGSSFNDLTRCLVAAGMGDVPVHHVPAWFHHPGYLSAMAARIRAGVEALGGDVHLLFSAHGLPSSYVRKGDPYQGQVQETVRSVLRELRWGGGASLAWQSRVGPVRWLAPSTEGALAALGAAGVTTLLVVPVSFVGDHIETLYEIDVTYREVARAAGITRFALMPPLDDHPDLVACLADQVQGALRGERVCVRCALPREDAWHYARRCPDCHFRKPLFVVHEQERRERALLSRAIVPGRPGRSGPSA